MGFLLLPCVFLLAGPVLAIYDYDVLPYGSRNGYNMSIIDEERLLMSQYKGFVPNVCKPIHLGVSLRHGARYPGLSSIVRMRELVDRMRGNVFNSEFSGLNDTSITFSDEDADRIAPLGRLEMKQVAHQFVDRFPDLLGNAEQNEMVFRSSSPVRVFASAEEFKNGLSQALGTSLNQDIVVRNDIIYWWANCSAWTQSIVENGTAMAEYIKYQTGPELTELASVMKERLQLAQNMDLSQGTSSQTIQIYPRH